MITDKFERERRLLICDLCPNKRKDAKFLFGLIKMKGKPQCKVCKCLINNMVIFEDVQCDLGKWKKE